MSHNPISGTWNAKGKVTSVHFLCLASLTGPVHLGQVGADGGPDQEELLELLHSFDISTSRCSSTVNSRAPSPSPSLFSIMHKASIPSTPIFHRLGVRGSGRQMMVPTPLHSVSESPLPGAPSSQSSWTDGPWAGLRPIGREGNVSTPPVRPCECLLHSGRMRWGWWCDGLSLPPSL